MSLIPQLHQPVLLFDGVCNLCNHVVQFVIKHDKKGMFKFASLQSPFGQTVLRELHMPANVLHSVILVEKGKAYTKSTAALKVAKHLSGLWPVLYVFMLVPRFIRNALYDVIANNRYKWFGVKDECWVPTPQLKTRFFEGDNATF